MLFNSFQFLLFFPIVVVIYFLLPQKYRWVHLLTASCIFYAAFIPEYLLILLLTIIVDYFAGIYIENAKGKQRKLFLIVSIFANVGILAVFKYYNFFIENINGVSHLLGLKVESIPYWKIILPIGLSFHTFQAMSYTIEVYRGNQKAERHFGIYSLYVMFFPQLVAGPIERPQNLLHQFKTKHNFNSQNLLDGLRLISWGLFKKVVIADRLSVYVGAVYEHPSEYHFLNLMIATIFFSIQIYCDFSGYSDMAIGIAKVMGFDLMINFRRPYFSTNIQQFWKRWHISLSTWFRDYLYIGLGGNRKSVFRTYVNVCIIFLVSGFWHGANWTFVVWGAVHAFFIVLYMLQQKYITKNEPSSFLRNALGLIITYIIVCLAWVFFRAANVSDAFLIIKNMLTLKSEHPFLLALVPTVNGVSFGVSSIVIALLMMVYMFTIEKIYPPNLETFNKSKYTDIGFMALNIILVICLGVFQKASFIYFQF
jgi:alginate O-acetyltransferase complex protein AlgI